MDLAPQVGREDNHTLDRHKALAASTDEKQHMTIRNMVFAVLESPRWKSGLTASQVVRAIDEFLCQKVNLSSLSSELVKMHDAGLLSREPRGPRGGNVYTLRSS